MQLDSPATTTASITNGKMSEERGQALPSRQAGSGSSKATIQSSSSFSVSEGDRVDCSVSPSTPLQHSGRKGEVDEEEQEEAVHSHSTALVLEVDMRFSSEPLDQIQSDRSLSAGTSSTFSQSNQLQVLSESDIPTESKRSTSAVDLENGQESCQHSQAVPLTDQDQSRAENTGVIEAVSSDICLSQASGASHSSVDNVQNSSSTLVKDKLASPTLERESGDETASFKQETELYLRTTQDEPEAVRSDISLTIASVSQTSISEPCFQSHSGGSHSSFRGLGSSPLVGVAKEPVGGIGDLWSMKMTNQRPSFLNSKSSDFDSSTLKVGSSSEKFSSPFSGNLSSFGIPFSFQSQTLSTSSQTSEEEIFHSQHDLDTSISESSLSHPPLQSSSTLLASGGVGSYTFSSFPAAIKAVTSSRIKLTEEERTEGAYTQTSETSLQFDLQSRSNLQDPTGLTAETDVVELGNTQLLLESFDTGEEEHPETMTHPELKVNTAGKTDSRHEDVALGGVSLENFADERESVTPTQTRRYCIYVYTV